VRPGVRAGPRFVTPTGLSRRCDEKLEFDLFYITHDFPFDLFVLLSTVKTVISARRPMSMVVNAMTIDVEDYFQVSAFDDVVGATNGDAPAALSQHHAPAETFDNTRSAFCARLSPTGFPVRPRHRGRRARSGVARYGHRIVIHKRRRIQEDVRRARNHRERFRSDLSAAIARRAFRSRSNLGSDVLVEEGYRAMPAFFPIRHDRYGFRTRPDIGMC
jgi:hypothetical protein